jgi:hypothetical protein
MEDSLNRLVSEFVVERVAHNQPSEAAIIGAVMGGQRLAPLKDTLNRLLRVTAAADAVTKNVTDILAHVGEIQFLRDRLAHNGAFPDLENGRWWFGTTNVSTVRERKDSEMLFFTHEMLLAASHDLEDAWELIDRQIRPQFWAEVDDQMRREDPAYAGRTFPPTWRYKPSELRRERPRSQPKRKSRQPPPRSSPP